MQLSKHTIGSPQRTRLASSRTRLMLACIAAVLLGLFSSDFVMHAEPAAAGRSAFRDGEKLTYTVSFENLKDVAMIETSVVSRGKLSGKDVAEIRGRLKTYDLVSAAFTLIDESRTVYADPETGLPLFISRTVNSGALPKETTYNYLTAPTTSFDILTAFYAIRNGGGNGSFPLFEDGETSNLTARTGKSQKVRTGAGEFDTTISAITGSYLDARGIKELTVNLTLDDSHLPVLIRFKTAKGVYLAQLSLVQNTLSEPTPSPTPVPVKTPTPAPTPKPVTTPVPYVAGQPLLAELSFDLGEVLDYNVTRAGIPVGKVRLSAAERKLFQQRDGLKLAAAVTGIDQANKTFALGDIMTTVVNPDTLAPVQMEMKFAGVLKYLNQTAVFDARSGAITFGGANATEAPVGTHTILSLVYSMRSFNLRPSKDPANRVNDTRVAVFWADRPYVFTLRPGNADTITYNGEKVAAQLITIVTGNPELDQLGIKVWLSTDNRRLPLRFVIGGFQADLTAASNILAK